MEPQAQVVMAQTVIMDAVMVLAEVVARLAVQTEEMAVLGGLQAVVEVAGVALLLEQVVQVVQVEMAQLESIVGGK